MTRQVDIQTQDKYSPAIQRVQLRLWQKEQEGNENIRNTANYKKPLAEVFASCDLRRFTSLNFELRDCLPPRPTHGHRPV